MDIPRENITPIKISENNTKEINTNDFFASTCDDILYKLILLDT